MIPSMETAKKARMTVKAATRIPNRATRMAIPRGQCRWVLQGRATRRYVKFVGYSFERVPH